MKKCEYCNGNHHEWHCPMASPTDYEKKRNSDRFNPTISPTDYADKDYLKSKSFWTSPTWFSIKLTAAILAFIFVLGWMQGQDEKMAQIAHEHAQMMQEKAIKDKREEELQAKFDALSKQGEYLTGVKSEKVKK